MTALEGAEPAARWQMLDRLARECIVAYYLLTIKAGRCGELNKVDFNNMEPSECSEDWTAKRDGKVPPGRDWLQHTVLQRSLQSGNDIHQERKEA